MVHLPDTLRGQGAIGIDLETRDPDLKSRGPGPHRGGYICGVSIGTEAGFRTYLPVEHESGDNLDKDQVFSWLGQQLKLPVPKIGARLVYDLGFLINEGVPFTGPFYDVQVAEPLLDENQFVFSLDRISLQYLNEQKKGEDLDRYLIAKFGKKNPRNNIWRAPAEVVEPYAIGDVDLPLRIFPLQRQELERQGLWDLFIMESNLVELLARMHLRGVKVDLKATEKLDLTYLKEYDKLIAKIKHQTGIDVSIWAAKSVAKVFDHLGLSYPLTAKTKQPSFTAAWLDNFDHPIGADLRRARWLDKMRGTFLRGCLLEGHHNGRVHSQFNQLKSEAGGTVTGRFSCVAGWTPVVTRRGTIPISQVRIGDEVFTHRGRWRKVTHTWIKGQESMLALYLSNDQVLTCTRGHRVYIQNLDIRSQEHQGRSQVGTESLAERNRSEVGDDVSQRFRRAEIFLDMERAARYVLPQPFTVENGRQEPDGGEVLGGTSWLERSHQWQEKLSDDTDRRRAYPLSSVCLAERQEIPYPSYRRGHQEQSSRQSGFGHSSRAPDASCFAEERSQVVKVEKVQTGGTHFVYDISVEEDESYLACGVFSHNSSLPNLQFIPVRTEEAARVRAAFLPDDGQSWLKTDYSQIEYRLIVHDAYCAGMRGAEEVVRRYNTETDLDFHRIVAEMTGLDRTQAKTINFGLAYGEGVAKLAMQLGLSIDDAENMLSQYHSNAPFIRPLARMMSNMADKEEEVRTLLNRKRRFHSWSKRQPDGSLLVLPHRFPGSQRAFLHKALNARVQGSAADIMKKSMVDLAQSGVLDVLGVPHLTVHDELDFSVPPGRQGQEAAGEVKRIMENCVPLSVPLKVDAKTGKNWGEAA